MVRKKLDNRIRVLIENGVALHHRTLFAVVGDKGRDQVVILHHILSKAKISARPSVLWCYKKELGFSSHRKKRMKQLQKKLKRGAADINEDDPFELFIAATQIRYCYYSETHKILGNTYGMCVLQDFEALTPNLLARTIETVEGGGIILLLLRSVKSLKQLYTITMDVHARYRTEAHQDVVGRFNERFILSLASCPKCLVMDDQLNILPISSHMLSIDAVSTHDKEAEAACEGELLDLKETLKDTQPVGVLVKCARTVDQAKALMVFCDAILEKTLTTTVSMTAARGRGKSAALGLAIAAAVAFDYSNIFVTSPSPENLRTLFEFIFKGFDALDYQEHLDYELVESTNPEFNKAIVRVNIYKSHRQTIQYIHPKDANKLGQAELVVIDEAAAIPLPLVKNLLGPYLVFMSSTVNGYEGTGRSLSLKLLQQLRQQTAIMATASKKSPHSAKDSTTSSGSGGRILREIRLETSIRYSENDDVESWLNNLLCLNVTDVSKITSGCPVPDACDLYYVNRDTLFCYHKASEAFLQRIMSLMVASHYKNTPNDLQMMSDAPAHHMFVLLGPVSPTQNTLPEILCVIQVCLEGEISKSSVMSSLSRGQRASGDLIPWTVSQQFQDADFASLSGGRIVRIATHPDYQGMGYGSKALQLLQKYYEGKITSLMESEENAEMENESNVVTDTDDLLGEKIVPRKNLPPLLYKLNERKAERLNYLGVSYGLTGSLMKFWKRAGYVPVYLRQTANDLTGEHSCVMLKVLNDDNAADKSWLQEFSKDFRKRFLSLLSFQFGTFKTSVSLQILQAVENVQKELSKPDKFNHADLERSFSRYDLKRLELYSQNMVDYHLIMDLIPQMARMFFEEKTQVQVSAIQSAILLGVGLQHKSIDDLEKELQLPSNQLLAFFNRIVRKFVQYFNAIMEKAIEEDMGKQHIKNLPESKLSGTLSDELQNAANVEKYSMQRTDLSQFSISTNASDWKEAVGKLGKKPSVISVARSQEKKMSMKRRAEKRNADDHNADVKNRKKKKQKKKKQKV